MGFVGETRAVTGATGRRRRGGFERRRRVARVSVRGGVRKASTLANAMATAQEWRERGNAFHTRKEHARASSSATPAPSAGPTSAALRTNRAAAHHASRDFAAALDDARASVASIPRGPRATTARAPRSPRWTATPRPRTPSARG